MRILSLVVLALILMAVPTSASAQEGFTEHAYRDDFRLAAPSDWTVREDVRSVHLIALSPQDGPDDPFRENLNVTTQDVPEGATLDAFYDDAFAEIAKSTIGFSEIETRNVRIGGVPAKRLVYEYPFGQRAFRVLTYVLLDGDQGYFLTGTALAEQYDHYAATFEQIAESFRL
ncbi:MAG: DcrB-related protein [Rhodothermales bacterium]